MIKLKSLVVTIQNRFRINIKRRSQNFNPETRNYYGDQKIFPIGLADMNDYFNDRTKVQLFSSKGFTHIIP
ncbi:MAG: hypothetical protein NPINA01_05290 [Nitrospinaceae bacterium]|nr:MAG: hypothetical protein NPINA01_05290 [Nitrospinaceae bacterium]